ncbi:MAG: choice-of-anchor Q domain-containing protein [Roseibacillus sp.]
MKSPRHLLCPTLLIFSALPSLGGTVTNNSATDPGSLRSTIASAVSGETIDFAPNLDGETITLEGQISITKDLIIDASSLPNGITIDGNGAVTEQRVFILPSAGTETTFRGLTITGGSETFGGAIQVSQSTLKLYDCTLTGNTSDFIGGAIYVVNRRSKTSPARLEMYNCSLFANYAEDRGGAIFLNGSDGGTVSGLFESCTFAENRADDRGGAIISSGPGTDAEASLILRSCTISNNQGGRNGGGGVVSDGRFEGNSVLELDNTIIAGNTAPFGIDLQERSTSNGATFLTLTGVNLISDLGGNSIVSGTVLEGLPGLAPLGNYGGKTPTMPPLLASLAIDPTGGITTDPGGTDQRGFSRFVNGTVDIGASEFQGAAQELNIGFFGDHDGDGTPTGLEQAVGSDPLVVDLAHPNKLMIMGVDASGQATLSFGYEDQTIGLNLLRSTNLESFVPLITGVAAPAPGMLIEINDPNPATGGKAFYKLEAVPLN